MDPKIKELKDRYPRVEDSKEKSKIRKQLRKLGYYLSKENKTAAPAKPAATAAKPAPVSTDSAQFIFLELKIAGEIVYGGTIDISSGKIAVDITPA